MRRADRLTVSSAVSDGRGAEGSLAARQCSFRVRLSRNGGAVRVVQDDSVMGQNFIACDREQVFLMPPDVREWLPESHLAWFVIDAVQRWIWRRSTRLIAPTVTAARPMSPR